MQAGIRKKEYAVAVIFGRLVLPIVIGGGMALWVYGMGALAEWSAFKRYGIVATAFILAYKAPDLYLKNKINKRRSEEHTSELQSLMRISYAVFCWKQKTTTYITHEDNS